MKKVHDLEVTAFSQQSNAQRYNYFVAKVFEWQEVWGLYEDGWVVSETNDKTLFPLWPAEAFAKRCLVNDWQNTKPKAIPFAELVNELLPALNEDNIDIAVFMVPQSEQCGVLPAQELLNDFITLTEQQTKEVN